MGLKNSFYRLINPVFFGMFGTSNGPNPWVFVDRMNDDSDFTALTALTGTATMATASYQRRTTTIARPSHGDECT